MYGLRRRNLSEGTPLPPARQDSTRLAREPLMFAAIERARLISRLMRC